MSCFIYLDNSSSRKLRLSPSRELHRKSTGSRIPTPKSLNEDSSLEVGRHLFVLNNGLFPMGSHGDSSDEWSMQASSELMASSQRERSSFNSKNLTSSDTILDPEAAFLSWVNAITVNIENASTRKKRSWAR
ncbi:hypothetical protein HPP92_004539 [Vanilla planifolia]|uniref:Uncharacterized protein n=1 Tax=Vanilla planifolia TaxID=51239 RepID=A0A835RSE4_VANPL|nr:hypothetical protein HPP92_004539 [Vanilla planifolia]